MKSAAVIAAALLFSAFATEAGQRVASCAGAARIFCDSSRSLVPPMGPRVPGDGGRERAHDASRAGQVLPLERILEGVRRSYPGRMLDASLVRGGTGYIYLIKIIDDENRVRILQVDAETGRMLGGR